MYILVAIPAPKFIKGIEQTALLLCVIHIVEGELIPGSSLPFSLCWWKVAATLIVNSKGQNVYATSVFSRDLILEGKYGEIACFCCRGGGGV